MELERITPEQAGISGEKVKECIQKLMHDETQMHGFMAARDGKVFAEGWWTPYGPERIHCNHSLGKSYTAAAIGILYTQRKLKLEERVVDLFADELRQYGIEPDENMKKLTVYHVLTMTNGMARHPIMDAEWLKNYLAEPVVAEPGTEFLYNSSGSCLLGAIVKKKTGKGMREVLKEFLFDKIGIDGERFQIFRFPDGYDAEPGTASVTEDNLRLAILFMNYGNWNGEQIIAEDWMHMAMSCQISTEPNGGTEDYRHGYGFQLWNSAIPGVYRFDGGQGQYGLIWPERKIAVAIHEGAVMPEGPQITLDVLYEYLLNEMRNEPLPENPQADAALLEFERNLKVPEQEANTLYVPTECFSGSYAVVSGDGDPWISVAPGGYNFFTCFYHADKKQAFTDFTLKMDEQKCVFTVDGYAVFEAYFDGKHHPVYTDNVLPEIGWNCSYARYLDEDTLQITTKWLNGWFDDRIVMKKKGDILEMTFYKDRLTVSDNRYTIKHCTAKRQQ